MSTIEKLFVQIFDRKRQITEKLKHQKQLYDQHLLSKLLIQGIPPPAWLLNSDNQSSTSDLNAFNKEELISGLLLPKPGPFASYTSGPCFLYDQPVLTAANSGIQDETCAGKCASSNGVDEDSAAPPHLVDGTVDLDGTFPPCHIDGTEDMAGTVPPCHADGTEDTAGTVPPCHVDVAEDTAGIVPLHHIDDTEDKADIIPLSQVVDSMDTSSYVPMSPEDQTDTRLTDAYKPEHSLVKIQRSRSRQKALELRNSAKASTKSRLGKENDVGSFHDGKLCRYDEHIDLRRSLELAEPITSPTEIRSNEEVAIGNCSNKESSVDACGGSLTQVTGFDHLVCSKEEAVIENCSHKEKNDDASGGPFTHSTVDEANEVEMEDNQKIKEYNKKYGGRITRSRSSSQQKGGSFSNTTNNGAKEVDMRDTQTNEEYNIVYGGRFTRSKSSCQQSMDGAHPLNKSVNVCIGQVTSSMSGLMQLVETSIGNENKPCCGKITFSKSNEVETRSWRSMSREVSVKPKQLDFDEVEENNFGNITNCLSVSISQDTLEERNRTHTIENSSTFLGTSFIGASPESLEYKAHGTLGSEIAHQVNSKSDKTPGQTLMLQDSVDVLRSSFDADADAVEVTQLSPGRTPVGSVVPVTDFAPTVEILKPGSLSNGEVVQASSSIHEKQVGGSKLFELGANFSYRNDMDGSWPCYKRRKIEYQNPIKSSSPTLRTNSYKAISESMSNISSWSEKENIPLMFQKPSKSHNSGTPLSDCAIHIKETDQSVPSLPSKEHVLTPQVDCRKGKASLGRIDLSSMYKHQNSSKSDVSNVDRSITAEPSDFLTHDGIVKTNALSAVTYSARVSGGLVNDQDLVDSDTVIKLMDTKMALDHTNQRVHEFKLSIGSPLMECMKVAEGDQTMPDFMKKAQIDQTIPEFDHFVIDENTIDAQCSRGKFVHEEAPILDSRISLSEMFRKSATFGTPVSPFPTGSKMYLAPGIYSSVPNGLLENIDLQNNLLPSGSAILGKSHSDLFSFPGRQYWWEIKKPFLSPVGKGFEGETSKSGSSDKLGSSNMDLTCFPIQEDPESGEEDVNDADGEKDVHDADGEEDVHDADGEEDVNDADTFSTGAGRTSLTRKSSTNIDLPFDTNLQSTSYLAPDRVDDRDCLGPASTDVKESICDKALQNESSLAPDDTEKRYSQGSVCTELNTFETHNDGKKSSIGQNRDTHTRLGKENKGFSVGAYSSKKHSKPPSSRFSKPKLSSKSSLRSRGQSLSEKEQKRNNIVSNIKSFVPLVHQKQAAAALPEKRDVKVKALQAAEAAKRAAEIKENERNQKKEAMKLERARLEQKNMKEMELKRKLQEEQRKKREAENAAKKRQREEEEKKEKERKKQRIEEARLQHKQAEDKLQAWKEESRCAPEEERAHQRKDFKEKTEKQLDLGGYEGENSEKPVNDLVVGSDRREAEDGLSTLIDHKMSTGSSAAGKVGAIDRAENSTPNVDSKDKPTRRTSASESYDISPYQCSDDEEEEVDRIPNKKFVPTWASSRSAVSLALSSLQHVDPDVMFPPGSFCSLDEVLLPRRLPQK